MIINADYIPTQNTKQNGKKSKIPNTNSLELLQYISNGTDMQRINGMIIDTNIVGRILAFLPRITSPKLLFLFNFKFSSIVHQKIYIKVFNQNFILH